MDISKFLSKVIGIYFIVITTAMCVNMPQFLIQVNSLINDAPLMFVTGFFTLILGILMIVSHNIWQCNWRVIITILSWITFLKGASLLFFPQLIDQTTILFFQNINTAYLAAGFDFILGIILSYYGFRNKEGQA